MSDAETIAELRRSLESERKKRRLALLAYAKISMDSINLLKSFNDKLKEPECSGGLPRDFYHQRVDTYMNEQSAAFDSLKAQLKEIDDGQL